MTRLQPYSTLAFLHLYAMKFMKAFWLNFYVLTSIIFDCHLAIDYTPIVPQGLKNYAENPPGNDLDSFKNIARGIRGEISMVINYGDDDRF